MNDNLSRFFDLVPEKIQTRIRNSPSWADGDTWPLGQNRFVEYSCETDKPGYLRVLDGSTEVLRVPLVDILRYRA